MAQLLKLIFATPSKLWTWCVNFVGPSGGLDDYDIALCPKCDWAGRAKDLLDGEACPRCKLVLPDQARAPVWTNAREPHVRISGKHGVVFSARLDHVIRIAALGGGMDLTRFVYPLTVTVYERREGEDRIAFRQTYSDLDFPRWGEHG